MHLLYLVNQTKGHEFDIHMISIMIGHFGLFSSQKKRCTDTVYQSTSFKYCRYSIEVRFVNLDSSLVYFIPLRLILLFILSTSNVRTKYPIHIYEHILHQ
jgi:hypothetical protein